MSIGFAPVWQLAQNELTQVVLRGCASCAGSYTGQLEQRTDRRTTGVIMAAGGLASGAPAPSLSIRRARLCCDAATRPSAEIARTIRSYI